MKHSLFFKLQFAFIVSMALFGCVPEPLSITDIPKADTKIVVSSSAFIPEQSVALVLSKNYDALEGDLENNEELIDRILLSNATVNISNNGSKYELTESFSGLYTNANLPIREGESYILSIKDNSTNKTASAETKMMPAIRFEEVKVSRTVSGDNIFSQINLKIQDRPEQNWYIVNIQDYQPPGVLLDNFLDTRISTRLFTDEGRNGEIIEEEFVAFFRDDIEQGDTLLVSVANISKDYYDFLEKRDDLFFAIDIVSEPFNLPTNVVDGYGFFNLHITDYRFLEVE